MIKMAALDIQKTYKIYIGGKFPRTESGRFYPVRNAKDELIANMCLSSRKDFRNAVVAARKAQSGWANKTAYNRSQILYRLAEMLQSRSASFVSEMEQLGLTKKQATTEVEKVIETLVYYAGWCDKYNAIFSSVNPTATAHFNFSVHEPMEVIAAIAPEESPLHGLIATVAPIIAGGNSVVILGSESRPTSAISFAEVIQNSDVPAGVVNILTGSMDELLPHMSSHMDVNGLLVARPGVDDSIHETLVQNVKRLKDWSQSWKEQGPYKILDFQELKTTWHPVQTSAASGGGY